MSEKSLLTKAWYVIQDNQQLGPYSTEELKVLVDRGSVSSQTMIYPAKALKVEDLDFKKKNVKVSQTAYFKILIFLSILLSYPAYEFYFNFWMPFKKPAILDNDSYHKMLLASRINSSSVNFEWRSSPDNSKWWVSSNYPYDIEVEMLIESYPDGLIAGHHPVQAHAIGKLKNKFLEIDRISFDHGIRFEIGRYKIKLKSKGNKSGFRLFPVLIGKKWPTKFEWSDDLYIGVKSYGEWSNMIEQKKNNEKQKKIQEINEMMQKWETLKTILGQVRKGLNEVFNSKKKNKEIDKWTDEYKLNVAPLLTGLLKTNGAAMTKDEEELFRQVIERSAAQVMDSIEEIKKGKNNKTKPGEAFRSDLDQCVKRIEALRAIEKTL